MDRGAAFSRVLFTWVEGAPAMRNGEFAFMNLAGRAPNPESGSKNRVAVGAGTLCSLALLGASLAGCAPSPPEVSASPAPGASPKAAASLAEPPFPPGEDEQPVKAKIPPQRTHSKQSKRVAMRVCSATSHIRLNYSSRDGKTLPRWAG